MLTICSHCKQVISETPPSNEKVSHGICPRCLEMLESHIKQNKKTSEPSLGADPVVVDDYK